MSFLFNHSKFRSQTASALILVLWSAALMTLAVVGVVEMVRGSLEENVTRSRIFRARLLAQSGLALGLHPDVRPGDPILRQIVAEGPLEMYEVKLDSEDSRININHLLEDILPPNNKKEERLTFVKLLKTWGVDSEDAMRILDCLLDWVDPDSLERRNGAEITYYRSIGKLNIPPNRPFESVEEMKQVRYMDILIKKNPNWQDAFTIYGSGKVNVNFASQEILEVAADLNAYQAQAIIRYRKGKDGKEGTEDDVKFTDLAQVLPIIGLPQNSESDLNRLNERLSLEDQVWRIESQGTIGEFHRTITLIANRSVNPPLYIEWQEK